MKDTLFSLLKESVNVIVVDDRPDIFRFIKDFLSAFKIYSLSTASCTNDALELIEKSERRFHVCLFDLGLDDVMQNEFLLLDRFGRTIPFIITSATEDTEKAFECKKRGAKAFVRKGSVDFMNKIIKSINQQALLSMICPKFVQDTNSPLSKFVNVLLQKNPEHINEWAREANITDRQLRYEWETHLGFSPKHSLCIYHLFSKLFEQIEIICSGNKDPDEIWMEERSQFLNGSIGYKRFLEYYFLNRSEVDASVFIQKHLI
jgi:response regulator RpfG family c-di-GMP phosphodiesterase